MQWTASKVMNKAFVKEPEGDADDDELQDAPLPPGSRNYLTPAGYAALRAELSV